MSASGANPLHQDQLPTARLTIRRAALGPLREALQAVSETPGLKRHASLMEEILVFSAAGVVMSQLLATEHRQAGRRVQLTIYGLHRLLGGPGSEGDLSPEALHTLGPWTKWLAHCGRLRGSRWPVLMRWVDIFSERLTMNRYGDRGRRALHAKGLMVAPLLQLLSETAEAFPPGPEKVRALENFSEALLGVWDLIFAVEDATVGWNRVEMPQGGQLGGFYGVSDTAQPPGPEAIRQAAEDLMERLRAVPVLDGPLDGALAALAALARQRLSDFIEHGVWPEHYQRRPSPPAQDNGLLNRIADRIRQLKSPKP